MYSPLFNTVYNKGVDATISEFNSEPENQTDIFYSSKGYDNKFLEMDNSDYETQEDDYDSDDISGMPNENSIGFNSSLYESDIKKEEWFCYLMINFYPNTKTHTHVGKSREPVKKVKEYNKGTIKNARQTNTATGYWELEMIIGVFDKKADAIEFRDLWKSNSRGIKSRRQRGIDLAIKHKKTCWDKRMDEEDKS